MASIVSIEGFLKLGTISTNEQKNKKKEKKIHTIILHFQ